MLSSLCRRVLGHAVLRSRAIRRVAYSHPARVLSLNGAQHARPLSSCTHLCTALHASSAKSERTPVDEVLQTFSSRRREWHLKPIDSFLSALKDTEPADRERSSVPILSTFRAVAGGRATTAEQLEEVWRLAVGETSSPCSEAVQLQLGLYRDARLPPAPALLALAAARANDAPLTGQLVRCLCAAGRLDETAPLLERLRAAGHQPPPEAVHAVIVAHAARGDLDTARDMAQALLPAAAEDDSDHQLLLMRVYVAARRPGPLAALLARWYQQHGQMTLGQSVPLLEALVASGQLDQLQQVLPLVPWPRWGQQWGGCVRLQRLLVRLGRHQTALLLLDRALAEGGTERELVRLARALITEMAVTEQPVSAIAEVCASLHAGPLLPGAWFSAAEVLYRLGSWQSALQLLLAAHRTGLPLREHLFWPALLRQAERGDVEAVRGTLSEMVSAGLSPSLETLRDYALPVFVPLSPGGGGGSAPPAEQVVQHLKEAGLTAAAAADALTARLLADRRWHEAAAVCERYSASVSAHVLVSATLHALQLTAPGGGGTDGAPVPVDACVRVLRCALTCRAAHEDPVGAVLVELAQAAARSDRHERLLTDILQACGAAGVRVSPAAAELACERLSGSAAARRLQPALLELADEAVSSQPWENSETGTALPQGASIDDLEDHLVELTKKGGNTRGILRKLILMHCRKHNLERATALEQELTCVSASSSAADGEPLTPGLLGALLALHVHHGRLEEALGYQRRLQRGHDPTLFLDQFKQLDLAALLVRRGHSDDAVSLLEGLSPESDRSSLSMGCWRLLAAAADWGDPQLTGRLLQLLESRGVLTATGHHWGQLVRAHLVSGDLSGAVRQFCECARERRLAAYSHGLLLEVARMDDADQRHALLDQVVQQLAELHGPSAAQYELALALAEAGHVFPARRIMKTLGRSAHFSDSRLKHHCNRLSRAGAADALVRLLQALPHKEARMAVYWALLNTYERTEDLASVEDVIRQLEDGELTSGKIVTHARQLAERLRAR